MLVICHKTSPYTIQQIWDDAGWGITDEFKPRRPMEVAREKYKGPTQEQMERFRNRPGRVPWPWENDQEKDQ